MASERPIQSKEQPSQGRPEIGGADRGAPSLPRERCGVFGIGLSVHSRLRGDGGSQKNGAGRKPRPRRSRLGSGLSGQHGLVVEFMKPCWTLTK